MQNRFSYRHGYWSDVLDTGIEFGAFSDLVAKLKTESVFVITDCRVFTHYEKFLSKYPHWCLPEGEQAKTADVVSQVYEYLLMENTDRNTLLLGVGGGVVTDVTGFVASTYKRGMPFILVPTSLLAMTDAAIGGKNGINFRGYKNVIGCINQPALTYIDPVFLHTLSAEHYYNGLAEMLKTAFVLDESLLSDIENNVDAIHRRDEVILNRLLQKASCAKLKLVEADVSDKGIRHVLNFGHTLGHAVEMHDMILHGYAVAKGMAAALRMSVNKGYLSASDYGRCDKVMKALKLPGSIKMHDKLMPYIEKDKKRRQEKLHFVFLSTPGKALVEAVDLNELKKLMYAS
ncbi:MAG: 3-dehydroquinate synthase [Candidatus Delongbacteria bacterium]|jgi:3-dehydroquinate synthase|nr:3-dehydroquinate synthase [Candidatus Delongbacteria bacterium]